MHECDPSHETDLTFSSSKLDVHSCDDGASFLNLQSGVEEVLGPFLTTLHLVVPSLPSTVENNITFIMTFFNPHFPLAQLMKFEICGTFCVDPNVDKDDISYEFGHAFIEVHDLHEILVGSSCMDVVVTVLPSSDLVDVVSYDPLDIVFAVPSCSIPSPSPDCFDPSFIDSDFVLEGNEVDCFGSSSTFGGYDASFDPCSLYLEDMPR